MKERGAGRGNDELRARPDEQPAVERDEHRRREHRGHDRLETVCRRPRVGIQTRYELARALAAEKAHGEPEEMATEVRLQRRSRADADPERQQVVAEIDPALEETRPDVHGAEQEDRVEPVLH